MGSRTPDYELGGGCYGGGTQVECKIKNFGSPVDQEWTEVRSVTPAVSFSRTRTSVVLVRKHLNGPDDEPRWSSDVELFVAIYVSIY